MTPMRIAVVGLRSFPSTYSGIERTGEELYPRLIERGHQVTVFGGASSERPRPHSAVRLLRAPSLPFARVETLSRALAALPMITRSRFDVVHLHAVAPAGTAPLFRFAGVPTVATIHGLDARRARWRGAGAAVLRLCERTAVRYAHRMIVVSRELRDYFWATYRRDTTLIYNAIAECSPAVLPARPRSYMVFIGRLVPEKRVIDLIGAFRTIPDDLDLVIAGTGPSDHRAELLHAAGGDRRIRFIGHQGRAAVRSLLAGAVLFASPSELEGFPMAVLEAVAASVPVVVTDIPPHRELFAAIGGDAALVPTGDRAEIAARIRHVLACASEERTAARVLAARVVEVFNVTRMVEETERVLADAAWGIA